MEKVIAEIIISALVITMLFISVPLYKNNKQLMTDMAGKTDYSEKIKGVMSPVITDNDLVDGSQVVSVIRYYAQEGGLSINVLTDHGLQKYDSITYDESTFKIDYIKNYSTKCDYINSALSRIIYTQVN